MSLPDDYSDTAPHKQGDSVHARKVLDALEALQHHLYEQTRGVGIAPSPDKLAEITQQSIAKARNHMIQQKAKWNQYRSKHDHSRN